VGKTATATATATKTTTKEKLIRAGEQLFAKHGVDGALTRDIVRLAGQANDSVVHYHFGSRTGLLGAICIKHIASMEEQRLADLRKIDPRDPRDPHDPTDLDAVVAALVGPTAAKLTTEDGRDFLRIIVQIGSQAGVREHATPAPLLGTALKQQLDLLEGCCVALMPEPIALERIASVIGLLTTALADRARLIEGGARLALRHEAFVANLNQMIVAALTAPPARLIPTTPTTPTSKQRLARAR
jgi:AcrR family transcriptional regulator